MGFHANAPSSDTVLNFSKGTTGRYLLVTQSGKATALWWERRGDSNRMHRLGNWADLLEISATWLCFRIAPVACCAEHG